MLADGNYFWFKFDLKRKVSPRTRPWQSDSLSFFFPPFNNGFFSSISIRFRTLVFPNGSLEINVTSLKDSGNFTCIASNAAGESTGRVELVVTAMPHLANSTSRSRDPSSEPAPSDILTSSKAALPNNETRGAGERKVSLVELTGDSALIRWSSQTPITGVRMFQIQYNSSGDDALVYRSVYLHP